MWWSGENSSELNPMGIGQMLSSIGESMMPIPMKQNVIKAASANDR